MIPSWLRALVGAGTPGRPSRTPTVRHRPRTILRLEAVEDRTVASATSAEPPATLLHAAVPGSDAPVKPTDQSKPPSDKNPDGSTADQSTDAQDSATVDTSILMAGSAATDLPVVGSSVFAEVPGPRTASLVNDHSDFGTSSSDPEPSPTTPAKESARPTPTTDAAGLAPTVQTAGPTTAATNGRGSDASIPASGNATPAAVARATSNISTGNGSAAATPTASTPLVADVPSNRIAGNQAASTTSAGLLNGVSDGNLLQRFVTNRDQAAFAALVQRYGGMVLGVCQKVIGDYHAAQDASQATFMVLARKAGMLDRSTPLGGWLYKVAYHIALRSRGVSAKQRLGEKEAADELPISTNDTGPIDVEQREVHQVLREELQGLPERYRAPLTLCYVDGRSHADAAKEIGLPRGSMAKRVGEGLERLRERLLHRGVAL